MEVIINKMIHLLSDNSQEVENLRECVNGLEVVSYHDKEWIRIIDLAYQVGINKASISLKDLQNQILIELQANVSYVYEIEPKYFLIRRFTWNERILNHVHYWFSDENYSRDLHFQLLADEDGWIHIDYIMEFSLIKAILLKLSKDDSKNNQRTILMNVIKSSMQVESKDHFIRRVSLLHRVNLLMEHIFSDERYPSDDELTSLIKPDGWIHVKTFMKTHSKLHQVCLPQPSALRTILADSPSIEFDPDGTHLRKRKPIKKQVETLLEPLSSMLLQNKVKPSFSTASSLPPFIVVQYNILADMYCKKEEFEGVPDKYLQWSYRKPLLFQFLHHCQADIICLQEVQGLKVPEKITPDNHVNEIQTFARSIGYESHYFRKVRANGYQKNTADLGNMILFRADMFVCVQKHLISYARMLQQYEKNVLEYDKLLQPHVAGCVLLRYRASPTATFMIVCTHISSNYAFIEVQLAQTAMLVSGIQAIQRKELEKSGQSLPVVICGDFNVRPTSPVHELMVKGSVSLTHPELTSFPQSEFYSLFSKSNLLDHSLCLRSAYEQYPDLLTNFRGAPFYFEACLDYIFYSSQNLQLVHVHPLPSKELVQQENGGLPNSIHPSDHLPLQAFFKFI